MMDDLTWRCHVCGAERPDARISVHITDLSAQHGWPPGTFTENTRYCNDRPACAAGAALVPLRTALNTPVAQETGRREREELEWRKRERHLWRRFLRWAERLGAWSVAFVRRAAGGERQEPDQG